MSSGYTVKDNKLFIHDFEERFDYLSSGEWREDITELIIDDGVSEIPDGAFEYFRNLEDVRLPSSLKKIGDSAFSQCGALKKISLPEELLSLGSYAFQDALGLKELPLPASLTGLGEQALYIGSGSRLFAVNAADDNPAYIWKDGVLFSRDMTRLIKYPSAKRLAEYRVPETVTEIAGDAFAHTNYLHRIELPKSLRILGSGAFSFCGHIEELV
ncbi:MAG: leucine-rich repeat domain-containing protein, partial [Clostridia bacterium]|nr:leucine-rich repeat domain-containing protein [Clostridia bacterium]